MDLLTIMSPFRGEVRLSRIGHSFGAFPLRQGIVAVTNR
jgi:hypothetical protein